MATLRVLGRSAEDKLDLLRELDPAHAWSSPDDRFYCLCCSRISIARAIKIAAIPTAARGRSRLRCPTRGCEATPDAWALLSSREALSAARQRVTEIAPPVTSRNGSVAVVQRPLTRGRAPRNLAERENRRRTIAARVGHAFAQSLHRLAFDYRSLLTSLQPGTRRSIFHPLA